ncbi:MAG: response regulator transcription factor [Myxococcales bacterium]|nr:response regulator transcription factor [Myxococcales bacterium]MCB9566952.1 response regulator transcription factor [Myxococcales bacterium]MCB9704692.1 response regulator transcription factor [Myxococcales bacterium]
MASQAKQSAVEGGARLLVVEDELHLADALRLNFELEGYSVEVANSGRQANELLAGAGPFDAIVLDVMLPDSSGFDVCRRLRDAGDFSPVLMLTALGTTDDRVAGLEAGADDYLAKPFDLAELLARVRSLLRRRDWERSQSVEPADPSFTFGDARIDFDRCEATMAGAEIKLTRLELDLLRYFADNPERVLSRQELQEQVWKLANYPNSRMVDNFIMRLRRHFEADPAAPRFFVSVRGAGYKFVPEPRSSGSERRK